MRQGLFQRHFFEHGRLGSAATRECFYDPNLESSALHQAQILAAIDEDVAQQITVNSLCSGTPA